MNVTDPFIPAIPMHPAPSAVDFGGTSPDSPVVPVRFPIDYDPAP